MVDTSVPSLVSAFPNKYVEDLKSKSWDRILQCLGKRGDDAMLRLLLDCSLYLPVKRDLGAYNQISGKRVYDVWALSFIDRLRCCTVGNESHSRRTRKI